MYLILKTEALLTGAHGCHSPGRCAHDSFALREWCDTDSASASPLAQFPFLNSSDDWADRSTAQEVAHSTLRGLSGFSDAATFRAFRRRFVGVLHVQSGRQTSRWHLAGVPVSA